MSYELPLDELLDSLSKEGVDTSQLNIVEENYEIKLEKAKACCILTNKKSPLERA